MSLTNTIESLIFAAGKGMSLQEIYDVFQFQYTYEEVEASVSELKRQYSGDRGIILIEYDNKVEFQSNPAYGALIADVLMETKERALSASLLETLSIIAYNQPITRSAIEDARGKSPDYAVSALLHHNLIKVVGRKDVPGKPLIYGTTDEFLRRFKLKSLSELPNYDELLNSIRNNFDKYYKSSDSLYQNMTLEEEFLEASAAKDADEIAYEEDVEEGDIELVYEEKNADFLDSEEFNKEPVIPVQEEKEPVEEYTQENLFEE